MKLFSCEKCGSVDVFIKKSGNQTGLYCGDCGKWIKWLTKDEIRLVERQILKLKEEHNSCEYCNKEWGMRDPATNRFVIPPNNKVNYCPICGAKIK